jgi:predicted DNA-binding ribbon-helix-helix protein
MTKRSLTIAGHRTSISLEDPFWLALGEIARARRISLPALVAGIDRTRSDAMNLSAALRVYVLEWFRGRVPG